MARQRKSERDTETKTETETEEEEGKCNEGRKWRGIGERQEVGRQEHRWEGNWK